MRQAIAVATADGSISILVDAMKFAFKTSDPRVAASVWDSVAVRMLPPSLAGCDWGDYGGLLARFNWSERDAFEAAYASCLRDVRSGTARAVAVRRMVTDYKDASGMGPVAEDFVRRCADGTSARIA